MSCATCCDSQPVSCIGAVDLNSGGGSVVEEGSVNTDEASDQADQQVMNNL